MKLIFSKRRLLGKIYALSICFILLILSGVFIFDILTAHPGSDFLNNINSVIGASEGAYWAPVNAPSSIYQYLIELHFYFWLAVLSGFFQDDELLLRIITLFLTFMLIYPTLSSAAQLRNRGLLFAILIVLFMHPRFLDLVISNIRSASALVFVFYSLRVNGTKLKLLLMSIAATFHLAVLAPIFLHLLHLFWRRLPQRLSNSSILAWLVLLATGILIMAAKIIFPTRGSSDWEGGLVYTISIIILAAYTFLIGKSKANNEFVFITLGLISLVVWGSLLGYSTMRYFSFFFPFFAVMILLYDRRPQVLVFTFILWLSFTVASHSLWVLSL